MTSDLTLDLKGLKCPLPALRTAKALEALPRGARLTVLATDPMAAIDIPHLARQKGASVTSHESDGVLTFTLTPGGDDPA